MFTLIQNHNLYPVIQDMLIDLMELDYKKTIALLLEKNTIPTETIVEKLQEKQLHLFRVGVNAMETLQSKTESRKVSSVLLHRVVLL